MEKEKRKIRSHKDGRTSQLTIRINPAVKLQLQQLADGNIADWIERQVRRSMNEFAEYRGVKVKCQETGAEIDLEWALMLLKKYGMDLPQDASLNPAEVRWLMGAEAFEEYRIMAGSQLIEWDENKPYVMWEK